jgi:hypothetical protein
VFAGVSQRRKPSTTKGDSLGTSQFWGTPELGKRRSSGSAYRGSNPWGAARFQCIIRGRPASEGGSCLCQRLCSVWLHSNQKTERYDCVVERKCWALPGSGGFAPAPPGFIALMPVPMRGLCQRLMKKGCCSIPPRSVEAAESALGLLPSIALSSAQLQLIITAAGAQRVLLPATWSMALYLGGRSTLTGISFPQGGNSK